MTHLERVARLLQQRGRLNPVDVAAPDVIDGGAPIMRLAPRIEDLRNRGWKIRSERKMNGTVTYHLITPGPVAAATPNPGPVEEQEAPTLFDPKVAVATPQSAVRQDWEAA